MSRVTSRATILDAKVYLVLLILLCFLWASPVGAEADKDDYFELFVTSRSDNTVVTISDVNWHMGTIM